MTSKQANYTNILISVLFAAMMIVAPIVIDNRENSQIVVFVLIAIWLVPFFYLNGVKYRKQNQ